jgi:hypothetical protein
MYPDTLLKAALYEVEVFHRNMEGAKGWLEAMTLDTTQFSMDLAEQESTDLTEMSG